MQDKVNQKKHVEFWPLFILFQNHNSKFGQTFYSIDQLRKIYRGEERKVHYWQGKRKKKNKCIYLITYFEAKSEIYVELDCRFLFKESRIQYLICYTITADVRLLCL